MEIGTLQDFDSLIESVKKISADNISADNISAEKNPAERIPADRIPADRVPADRVHADRVPADRMCAEKKPLEESNTKLGLALEKENNQEQLSRIKKSLRSITRSMASWIQVANDMSNISAKQKKCKVFYEIETRICSLNTYRQDAHCIQREAFEKMLNHVFSSRLLMALTTNVTEPLVSSGALRIPNQFERSEPLWELTIQSFYEVNNEEYRVTQVDSLVPTPVVHVLKTCICKNRINVIRKQMVIDASLSRECHVSQSVIDKNAKLKHIRKKQTAKFTLDDTIFVSFSVVKSGVHTESLACAPITYEVELELSPASIRSRAISFPQREHLAFSLLVRTLELLGDPETLIFVF